METGILSGNLTVVASWLTFPGGVSINCKTGEVKIQDGVSLDDAARAFWSAVAKMSPGIKDSV